ncbi:hypothetical protein M5111_11360, partial [Neisseria meningitidis]|nr:hypothetical protein [Neisseria meningitidis]
ESIHTETCIPPFPLTYIPSFPRKCESSFFSFSNDESIHTETCIPSFPRTYIPSFPRKWESSFLSFSH